MTENKKEALIYLRNATKAPVDKCLEALEATNYDFTSAVNWLVERKLAITTQKDGYTTQKTNITYDETAGTINIKELYTDGIVRREIVVLKNSQNTYLHYLHQDKILAVAEFAGTNLDESALKPILLAIVANNVAYLDASAVPENIKADLTAKIEASLVKVPENARAKAAAGKLSAALNELTLVDKIAPTTKSTVGAIAENNGTKLLAFYRLETGEGF